VSPTGSPPDGPLSYRGLDPTGLARPRREPDGAGTAVAGSGAEGAPLRRQPGSLLDVRDLSVSFATRDGEVRAVDGVSFTLARGEVLALVGESGSGKSVCAMTLMGLTRGPNATIAGRAMFDGRDLVGASEAQLRRVRGAELAMVFQDPQSSLNPVYRVGDQIAEQIRAHEPLVSRARALERAGELMERLGIGGAGLDRRERVRAYPHELSGGMRQRVMIAMALSLGAKVLLADEPTTALDVTVQAQILAQLRDLRDERDLGILLITHDFGVVADIADRIAVMQAGRIVEQGTPAQIFEEPEHPYTRGLLEALRPLAMARPARAREAPARGGGALVGAAGGSAGEGWASAGERGASAGERGASAGERGGSAGACADGPPSRARGAALLEVRDLRVEYAGRGLRSPRIVALDGVSLAVAPGETLAIVGESGCGKTTLLRAIARLVEPSAGAVRLGGRDLAAASRRELARARRDLGMVFQDPQASLNPRRRVGATLERALRARGLGAVEARLDAGRLLERVGLRPAQAKRYPHELSGGERQRVGIARALAGALGSHGDGERTSGPQLVLLDEPVSSLDASLRRGVIDLLIELQSELDCAYVLVSHDFTTVEAVADRIAVMRAGQVLELGEAGEVLAHPVHPYTRELLAACPRLPGGVRSDGWASKQSPREPQGGSPPRETPQAQDEPSRATSDSPRRQPSSSGA
jgi:peptide/nickel transport system ATP-binding protein